MPGLLRYWLSSPDHSGQAMADAMSGWYDAQDYQAYVGPPLVQVLQELAVTVGGKSAMGPVAEVWLRDTDEGHARVVQKCEAAFYLGQREMQDQLYGKLRRRFTSFSITGWKFPDYLPLRRPPAPVMPASTTTPDGFLMSPERAGGTSSVALPSDPVGGSGAVGSVDPSLSLPFTSGSGFSGSAAVVRVVPMATMVFAIFGHLRPWGIEARGGIREPAWDLSPGLVFLSSLPFRGWEDVLPPVFEDPSVRNLLIPSSSRSPALRAEMNMAMADLSSISSTSASSVRQRTRNSIRVSSFRSPIREKNLSIHRLGRRDSPMISGVNGGVIVILGTTGWSPNSFHRINSSIFALILRTQPSRGLVRRGSGSAALRWLPCAARSPCPRPSSGVGCSSARTETNTSSPPSFLPGAEPPGRSADSPTRTLQDPTPAPCATWSTHLTPPRVMLADPPTRLSPLNRPPSPRRGGGARPRLAPESGALDAPWPSAASAPAGTPSAAPPDRSPFSWTPQPSPLSQAQ
nr:uncharacterized protein LOC109157428 [Ipomoea trifida]